MRVASQDNTTEVKVQVANQTLCAPPAGRVECGSTLRHQAKRTCRLCDPVSGQCRHLCVRRSGREIR